MIQRRADEPPAIIPELRTCVLTYDMHVRYGEAHPEPDEYLVSIGNKTKKIGTVYQVVSARQVYRKNRQPANFRRWALTVIRTPEVKDQVRFDQESCRVWVGETESWPIYWYSRDKKKR